MALTPTTTSKSTTFTPLPPSCTLFVPHDPTQITVGTYHLDPSTSQKSGSLHLYQADPTTKNQTLKSTHATHAILDIKFSPASYNPNTSHNPSSHLAVAQSHGTLTFFTVTTTLTQTTTHTPFDPTLLILSLSFSQTPPHSHLAFTLSNGEAGIFSLDSHAVIFKYRPHELEAWTCGFGDAGRVIYSGGDDSAICAWDVEAKARVWRDGKTHGAGVTAVLASGGNVITGSYDERLRVFDGRTRRVTAEVGLGGGVWRLQERGEDSLLASCMHAGVRVVSSTSLDVVARFEEHESMNYGSDVHSSDPNTIVSCSFYDKRLCIWSTT